VKLLGGAGVGLGLRAAGLATLAGWVGSAEAEGDTGGTLRWVLVPEPPMLVTAFSSAQMVQQISAKMMDGLVAYDRKLDPIPALAIAWTVSDDARTVTFKLRDGVKWHDGNPFTSADVKYTFEEILKKHHARGRATFANLERVDTPDGLTAVFRLSKPSVYMMAALSASESPVLPKHLYDKGDPTKSPQLTAPVGTGPFKFAEWQRGKFIRLVRNPDYWAKGEPHFDAVIVRFIPDAAARAVALETSEVDLGGGDPVPLADVKRLAALPNLDVTTEGYAVFGAMYYFEFNMRDPQFKDVRVRQAIAHAIDRDFVAKNTWFGYASAATGPISKVQPKFYTDNVPKYPFNPKRAEELLDQAGFPRQANGIRFKISHDPANGPDEYRRFGEYFKQAMKVIGIDVDLRVSDAATYQRRIWTDNAYQTTSYGIFTMPDPTIGVQRVFWSKNITKGVPYSNGSGYTSAEMDALLESAQTERDPAKRQDVFHKMQAVAMTDLPIIPIINRSHTSVYNKRLTHLTDDVEGVFGTFAALSRVSK
jgi:peptide/nickel transport system substrate-binding protein